MSTTNTLGDYSLLDALTKRRSRRFGLGMKMPAGPLAYQSRHAPFPRRESKTSRRPSGDHRGLPERAFRLVTLF